MLYNHSALSPPPSSLATASPTPTLAPAPSHSLAAHPLPSLPIQPKSRWAVVVLPPPILPHSPPPPHVSTSAHGYGPAGRYQAGLILPLFPTLSLQLAAIAREFSLPSTGGLSLHLSIVPPQTLHLPSPRLTDDSWAVLFAWAFERQPPPSSGWLSSSGLPIAARLEFDIDLRKARWFHAWATPLPLAAPRPSLQARRPHHRQSLQLSTPTKQGLSSEPDCSPDSSSTNSGFRSLLTTASKHSSTNRRTLSIGAVSDYEKAHPISMGRPLGPLNEGSEANHDFASHQPPNHDCNSARNDSSAAKRTLFQSTPPASLIDDPQSTEQLQSGTFLQSDQSAEAQARLQLELQQEAALTKELEAHYRRSAQLEQKAHQARLEAEWKQLEDERKAQDQEKALRIRARRPLQLDLKHPTYSNSDSQLRRDSGHEQAGADTLHFASSSPPCDHSAQPAQPQEISLEAENNGRHRHSDSQSGVTCSSETQLQPEAAVDHKDKMESTHSGPSVRDSLTAAGEWLEGQVGLLEQRVTATGSGIRQEAQVELNIASQHLQVGQTDHNDRVPNGFQSSRQSSADVIVEEPSVQQAGPAPQPLPSQACCGSPDLVPPTPDHHLNSVVKNKAPPLRCSPAAARPNSREMEQSSISQSFTRAFGLFSNNGGDPENKPGENNVKRGDSWKEDVDRIVNEKALAKEALMRANPERRVTLDADGPLPPLKETAKVPPPPPTRSRVIQMAKAFGSAESTPIASPHGSSSPRLRTSDHPTDVSKIPLAITLPSSPDHEHRPSGSTHKSRASQLPLLCRYSSSSRLSSDLSAYIAHTQEEAISRHGKFVIAISGGSLLELVAEGLLGNPLIRWESWRVFFTDERVVPLDHPDSISARAFETLFSHVPIKRSQIMSIMSLPPDGVDFGEMAHVVATIYEAQILEELGPSSPAHSSPRFDLILLGMGVDGHTCSLFPSHQLLRECSTVACLNDSPKPPAHRITLTLPVLNAAHNLAFVCTGESKSKVLAAVLQEDCSDSRPASLVMLEERSVIWFVDNQAAQRTSNDHPKYTTSKHISSLPWSTTPHSTTSQSLVLAGASVSEVLTRGVDVSSEVFGNDQQRLTAIGYTSTRRLPVPAVPYGMQFDSYPYALIVYSPVYPHLEGGLYPSLPGNTNALGYEVLSRLIATPTRTLMSPQTNRFFGPSLTAFMKADVYPRSLTIYTPLYPHVETGLYPALPGTLASAWPSHGGHLLASPQDLPDLHASKLRDQVPARREVGVRLDSAVLGSPGVRAGSSSQPYLSVTKVDSMGSRLESSLSHILVPSCSDVKSYPYNLVIYPPTHPYSANALYPVLPGTLDLDAKNCVLTVTPVIDSPLPQDRGRGSEQQALAGRSDNNGHSQHWPWGHKAQHPQPPNLHPEPPLERQVTCKSQDKGGEGAVVDKYDTLAGYPYNLSVYRAVYPYFTQELFCAPPPGVIFRPVVHLASNSGDTPSAKEILDVKPGNDTPITLSHDLGYPSRLLVIYADNQQISSGHGNTQETASAPTRRSTNPLQIPADQPTGLVAPELPLSDAPCEELANQRTTSIDHAIRSPVAIQEPTLSPSFYLTPPATSPNTIKAFPPSLQYTQQVESHVDSFEDTAENALGLHNCVSRLSDSFYPSGASLGGPPSSTAQISGAVPAETSPTREISAGSSDSEPTSDLEKVGDDWLIFPPPLAQLPAVHVNAQFAEGLLDPPASMSTPLMVDAISRASQNPLAQEGVPLPFIEGVRARSVTVVNRLKSLREMDSIDAELEPLSPDRLLSPDLSQRLASPENQAHGKLQFPTYCAYQEVPKSSPRYIETDWGIKTSSLTAASEISPSIERCHEKRLQNYVGASEDRPSDDQSHHDLAMTAHAISTDGNEPSPGPRRLPIVSQHSKRDSMSSRLSLLRSSPIPLLLSFSAEVSSSRSSPGSMLLTEESQTEVVTQDILSEKSPADSVNCHDFDLSRLQELTGQPLSSANSSGSVRDVDMGLRGPDHHESGIVNNIMASSVTPTDDSLSPAPQVVGPGSPPALPVSPFTVTTHCDVSSLMTHPVDESVEAMPRGEAVALLPEGEQTPEAPLPPAPILFSFPDQAEISEALGQFVYESQQAALQRHGKFQIALSGSCLPAVLADGVMRDDRIQWSHWEVFLVDEAIAPMDSEGSTYSGLVRMILQHVPVPASQIHSIAELMSSDVEEAMAFEDGLDTMTDNLADDYENELLACFPEASHETGQPPKFDLILVSLGAQGQVGSLFPGHPLLEEASWFVAWLGDAPKPITHHITFTLPVLNAAHQLAILAMGKKVSALLTDVLEHSVQPDVSVEENQVSPAALIKTQKRPVVWFTDFAAVATTEYPQSAFWDE